MTRLGVRERVYGNYPAHYNVYGKPSSEIGYHTGCLFKHARSDYTGTCTSDVRDKLVRGVTVKRQNLTPRPNAPRKAAVRSSKYSPHKPSKVRVKSAPSVRYMTPAATPISPQYRTSHRVDVEPNATEVKEAWSTDPGSPTICKTESPNERPSQPIDIHQMEPPSTPSPLPSGALKIPTPIFPDDYTEPPDIPSHPGRSLRRERIRSATIHRDRINIPKRPVYSAGPRRPVPPQVPHPAEAAEAEPPLPRQSVPLRARSAPGFRPHISQGHGDAPPRLVMKDEYDERVSKYGWRMEVHGDPLHLKDACRRDRLNYTVEVDEPFIPPNPPKARAENFDTYFLNTIPRRVATFDIATDWASETLHAKRMALHRREATEHGPKYRYRSTNYAFLY